MTWKLVFWQALFVSLPNLGDLIGFRPAVLSERIAPIVLCTWDKPI